MRCLPLIALAAVSAAATASPFADLAAIDRDVILFTGAAAGEPDGAVLPVDRRLRLAACRAPLALAWRGARRDTVVVQCPDAGGWRIFVPLRVAAVAIAAAPETPAIARGEAVTVAVEGEGFSISRSGKALDAGAVGAWIRVQTSDGRSARAEPVRAQVVRPGLVRVPL